MRHRSVQVWYRRMCRVAHGVILYGRKSSTAPLGTLPIGHDTEVTRSHHLSAIMTSETRAGGGWMCGGRGIIGGGS